jgi:hypothetical protein
MLDENQCTERAKPGKNWSPNAPVSASAAIWSVVAKLYRRAHLGDRADLFDFPKLFLANLFACPRHPNGDGILEIETHWDELKLCVS